MLLELLSPDRVQAYGIAATSILTAWLGWQQKRVSKLQARVEELETQSEHDRKLFAKALRYIRELLFHVRTQDLLLRQHAPQVTLPDPPEVPDELKEEV